jgi:hypothetical protein
MESIMGAVVCFLYDFSTLKQELLFTALAAIQRGLVLLKIGHWKSITVFIMGASYCFGITGVIIVRWL